MSWPQRVAYALFKRKFSSHSITEKSTGPIFDFIIRPDGSYWVQFDEPIPVFSHFDQKGNHLQTLKSRRLFSQLLQLRDGQITIGNKKNFDDDSLAYRFIGSYFEQLSGKGFPDFRAKYYSQLRNGECGSQFCLSVDSLTTNSVI